MILCISVGICMRGLIRFYGMNSGRTFWILSLSPQGGKTYDEKVFFNVIGNCIDV